MAQESPTSPTARAVNGRCASSTHRLPPSTSSAGAATSSSIAHDPNQTALPSCKPLWAPWLEGLCAEHALIDGAGSSHRRAATAELLQTLEKERPLAAQELRVYCLRLGKAGLSCRAIARLVGSSKSSVQRCLAAGTPAIDMAALVSERLERYRESWAQPFGGLSLSAQLRLLDRHAKRLGLYRMAAAEPEEKVLL